jgi:hypothetical protein
MNRRRIAAIRKSRIFVSALVACLLVSIAGVLLVQMTHFNPLTGIYTYDPRTDQPSRLVLANRPDLVLVDALTKQLARDGTYPPNAAVSVTGVEPIQVAVSTYTDWQAYAFVTTRLDYANGTARIEEFRFHSVASEGASLPYHIDLTYHAFYGRLAECSEIPGEPAGKSVCGLQ